MNFSSDHENPFVRTYSLVKRSGILGTFIGRQLFKSAYFFYKRHFEDDLQGLLQSFPYLIGSDNVLDIGANIGYTATVLARAASPQCKIFAFEPEPFNFAILQQTALTPEFTGKILAQQCAVGAESGIVDLWINDNHHGDHRVMTDQFRLSHSADNRSRVSQISIDSFLKHEDGKISFAKIDVQGYELAVCQGMRETLRQNPGIKVLLEFMPSAMRDMGFEPSHLIDLFTEQDFKIYVVHSGGKLSEGMPCLTSESSYINLLFSRRAISCNQ